MKAKPCVVKAAFTVVELLIVVFTLAIVGALLVPGLTRSHRHAPGRTHINCINNLKQIGLSFRTWALDNGDQFPMSVSVSNGGTLELSGTRSVFAHFMVMSNELSTPKLLFCPQEVDSRRTAATTFLTSVPAGSGQIPLTNDYNVSYFVGLDAMDSSPDRILTGDRRLLVNGTLPRRKLLHLWTNSPMAWSKPLHGTDGSAGHIGFADGSVQSINSSSLKRVLHRTGIATNRLDLP